MKIKLSFIMFWFCVFATSQQMHFLKYDVSSQLGLTTNNINDLLIDNKQFIWVGSENGLFKFDEKSFIHIPGTKPNEKILKLNYFDNKLYVLTNLKNIYTIQKNYAQLIFQKNNIKENINIEKINDFIISDSKTFYSIEEKIVEIKNRKIKTYNGIIYGNNTIGLNKNGHWKNSGLNKLDFEILKNETWFNEENCAIKMIESEIGMFFYKKNKSNEIYQLKGKALKKHVLPQIVESLAVDKNNQIWVSYIGNTLYKFDENFLTSTFQINKVKGKLIVDPVGNIWFGSINKGLFKFFNTNIQIYAINEAENLKNMYFLNNNKAYLETNDNIKQSFNLGSNTLNEEESDFYELEKFLKLLIFKNNKIEFQNFIKLFYKNNYLNIKTIQTINENKFILSTRHKIYSINLSNSELKLIYQQKASINDFLMLNNNLICIANPNQTFFYSINEKKTDKIFSKTSVNIIKKRGSQMIFATEKEGLIIYDINQKKIIKNEKIIDDLNNSLAIKNIELSKNKIFVITQNGLHEYYWSTDLKLKKFYNTTNGLPQNDIVEIQIFNNRLYGITKNYFFLFDLLNPSLDLSYTLEDPTIEKIQFGNKVLNDYENIKIDFRSGKMQLKLSSPFYFNVDRVKFLYKLNDYDQDWKTSTDGNIEYNEYPTGNQTLMFFSTLDNGKKKSDIKELNFNISQPFWFSTWFRWTFYTVFLVLILGTIAFSFYAKSKEMERDKEIVEFQQKALRAQINPHFLFNALNSIQNFAFKNDVYQLSNYIEKFATLTRSILKHSENEYISLRQEIDVLKNYMDIEKLRYQNFNYSLTVDKNIDDEMIFVPSLLFQPIVENAIWHGFQNSEKFGNLRINFILKDQLIKIEIEDNGVGRNFKNRKNHDSKGMSLIESRLKLLNNRNTQINIIDKKNEKENLGTLVEIIMPLLTIQNTIKVKKPLIKLMYEMIRKYFNKIKR